MINTDKQEEICCLKPKPWLDKVFGCMVPKREEPLEWNGIYNTGVDL